jgi:hypothetical protein
MSNMSFEPKKITEKMGISIEDVVDATHRSGLDKETFFHI